MSHVQSPKNRLRRSVLFVLFAIFCSSIITQNSLAQTVTLGSGTTTNLQIPFHSNYGYSFSQQIYTAAELNAVGISGQGYIYSIAFYCNTANIATTNFNAVTVFMGSTTQSAFSSTTGWISSSSLTNVGTWNMPSTTSVGWINFNLGSPFLWDGVSNLVIAMDENVAGYGGNIPWRSFSVTAVPGTERLSLCYYSDTANPDPNSLPTANYSSATVRSQMQLTFISTASGCSVFNYLQIVNSVTMLNGGCNSQTLIVNPNFSNYHWKRDGAIISGAQSSTYSIPPDPNPGLHTYVCEAFCETSGLTVNSDTIAIQTQNCFGDFSSNINYMLVQNVTTTGINTANQTAQVQFDLNWGYSWKDSINWDAAWVFMKYKNVDGEWKPCKINTTGYDHGQGTPNNINVPVDQMGAFVSMSQFGNAHVDIQGIQLQWDYSAEGLSNPAVVEVKVFAIEMVYIPQGDFNLFKNYGGATIAAPGDNFGVINNRLTPTLTYDGGTCRVKGDAGLDTDVDGTIDSPNYPTGFNPFYALKFEMSEQQYADFLNCLTTSQQSTLGVAGSSITSNNGVYFAASPNLACNGFTNIRALAYADWAGLRPMSVLEYSKAALGPYKPTSNSTTPLSGYFSNAVVQNVGNTDSGSSSKTASGSGYFGMKDMGGNLAEEVVNLNHVNFSKNIHGDGVLSSNGGSDVANWTGLNLVYCEPYTSTSTVSQYITRGYGFRFARTAE